ERPERLHAPSLSVCDCGYNSTTEKKRSVRGGPGPSAVQDASFEQRLERPLNRGDQHDRDALVVRPEQHSQPFGDVLPYGYLAKRFEERWGRRAQFAASQLAQ